MGTMSNVLIALSALLSRRSNTNQVEEDSLFRDSSPLDDSDFSANIFDGINANDKLYLDAISGRQLGGL